MSDENGDTPTPDADKQQQQAVPPLGLVQPGPISINVHLDSAVDGQPVVVVRIETTSTSWCQPILPALAKAWGQLLVDNADRAEATVHVPKPGLIVPGMGQ